ncbi:MAG: acyl carrier protein [Myxococcota bacterium]|nr:acyl carrier protein [Myxococcota bacterium]
MKSRTECMAVVEDVLREHCQVNLPPMHEALHLQADLGLDSMALLNLALEVENAFEVCLEEDPENPPQTIGEIVDLIQERLKEAS